MGETRAIEAEGLVKNHGTKGGIHVSATSPDTGQQAALNGAPVRGVSIAAASDAAGSPGTGGARVPAAAAGPGPGRHRDRAIEDDGNRLAEVGHRPPRHHETIVY